MLAPTIYEFSAFEEVTADQVNEYVARTPSDKSINDIMPMRVYKYVILQIVENFTHLINLSHLLHPFTKIGNHVEPNNYGPISIFLSLGKVYNILLKNFSLPMYRRIIYWVINNMASERITRLTFSCWLSNGWTLVCRGSAADPNRSMLTSGGPLRLQTPAYDKNNININVVLPLKLLILLLKIWFYKCYF